jgi:hypothetical protein
MGREIDVQLYWPHSCLWWEDRWPSSGRGAPVPSISNVELFARLCGAIVARLTSSGNVIETGTDSYRLAHTRAQQAVARS